MEAKRRIGAAQPPQGECEAFVRAKRSVAAAQRRTNALHSPGLDGDGPMWPPAIPRCVNAVAPLRGRGAPWRRDHIVARGRRRSPSGLPFASLRQVRGLHDRVEERLQRSAEVRAVEPCVVEQAGRGARLKLRADMRLERLDPIDVPGVRGHLIIVGIEYRDADAAVLDRRAQSRVDRRLATAAGLTAGCTKTWIRPRRRR